MSHAEVYEPATGGGGGVTTAELNAAVAKGREEAETASISLTQKGKPSGVAELDAGGKVSSAQIPPLALTEPHVVASEAAQLALEAQEGDFAIRTDVSKTFVHNGGKAGTMSDWTEIVTPGDVQSVNGQIGTVNLTAANVGADAAGAATKAKEEAIAAKKKLRTWHAWVLSSSVAAKAETLPDLEVAPAIGEEILAVRIGFKIREGTKIVFKLQKNGVDMTGFTALEATTAAKHATPTAVELKEGDEITLVITEVAGEPKGFSATLSVEHVL